LNPETHTTARIPYEKPELIPIDLNLELVHGQEYYGFANEPPLPAPPPDGAPPAP